MVSNYTSRYSKIAVGQVQQLSELYFLLFIIAIMKATAGISAILKKYSNNFHPVIPFDPTVDKLLQIDLSEKNIELTEEIFGDTGIFSLYVDQKLLEAGATYGVGGYDEIRKVYAGSKLFDSELRSDSDGDEEPRRLHLGMDIWGRAGTPVFAPLDGRIHSFAFNDQHGDYGATIILIHQLEGMQFFTLYGHLSLHDLAITANAGISRGQEFGHFGHPHENGHWPPHLHFQIMNDLGMYVGDYPGVCRISEREKYLSNCPDPALIIKFGLAT